MTFMKKTEIGLDIFLSKSLRIFTESDCWFIYFNFLKWTIRISNAGCFIYKRRDKIGFY